MHDLGQEIAMQEFGSSDSSVGEQEPGDGHEEHNVKEGQKGVNSQEVTYRWRCFFANIRGAVAVAAVIRQVLRLLAMLDPVLEPQTGAYKAGMCENEEDPNRNRIPVAPRRSKEKKVACSVSIFRL